MKHDKSSFHIDYYLNKISKLLDKQLTHQARFYLTDIVYGVIESYSKSVEEFLLKYKKRTVTENEIEVVTKILFSEDISRVTIANGFKSLAHYEHSIKHKSTKRTTTEQKSGLILSVSKIRHQFLQFMKPSKFYRVSTKSMIMLTDICQFIINEILDNITVKKIDKHEIHEIIKKDTELLKSLTKMIPGNICH